MFVTEDNVDGMDPEVVKRDSSRFLSESTMEALEQAIDLSPGSAATVLKCGPHWVNLEDYMAKRIFKWSSLVVQDESGLARRQFDDQKWAITHYGRFTDFTPDQQKMFHEDAEEWRALYGGSAPKPIDFTWGYGTAGGAALIVG